MLFLDVILSTLASFFVLLFFRWAIKVVPGFSTYVVKILLSSFLLSVLGGVISRSYKIIIRYSSFRSVISLAHATLYKEAGLLVLMLLGFFGNIPFRGALIFCAADFVLTIFVVVAFRVLVVAIFEDLNRDNLEVKVDCLNVMVYGTSEKSVAMAARLEQSTHYQVLGYLTPNKSQEGLVLLNHTIYHFQDTAQLIELKRKLGIEGILFPREEDAEKEKDSLVPMAIKCGLHILTTPRIEQTTFDGLSRQTVLEMSDSDFIPDGMSALERQIKRVVDLLLSAVLIVFFFPLFIICAVAVKLHGGPGPVLYKQERIGRFGRPFKIYKFRSMRMDAESDGIQLYAGDDDPRLTKVGRFLRVHHLDELPQLFNVFRGDMAFVGYRPERKYYIDKIMKEDPRYYYLFQIRPGVTSYATLKNGYAGDMQKMLRRLEFDLYYLRHRSAWFDIKILGLTFVNIVFGKHF